MNLFLKMHVIPIRVSEVISQQTGSLRILLQLFVSTGIETQSPELLHRYSILFQNRLIQARLQHNKKSLLIMPGQSSRCPCRIKSGKKMIKHGNLLLQKASCQQIFLQHFIVRILLLHIYQIHDRTGKSRIKIGTGRRS